MSPEALRLRSGVSVSDTAAFLSGQQMPVGVVAALYDAVGLSRDGTGIPSREFYDAQFRARVKEVVDKGCVGETKSDKDRLHLIAITSQDLQLAVDSNPSSIWFPMEGV